MLHNSRRAWANLLASLCLFVFAQPYASDSWTAEFVFPATTGYVMHNMDVMEVSYKSNYPSASLWAFCYNGKIEPENIIIMGVYNNAKPLDGAHVFQFSENFASDSCWYILRNLANDEKGITGVRFSYDWKTRDTPSTLKAGSEPETTAAPPTTVSTPATATPEPAAASSSDAPTSTPAGASTGAASTAGPGSSAAASQTSGGSASSAPGASTGSAAKPHAGASGVPLPNSTVPLINNGIAGGGGGESGIHGAAPPPLSTGVIAGIVVGSVLGVLGIAGFLATLWLAKRHRRSTVNRQSHLRERESKTSGRVKAGGKCLPGELRGDNKSGLVELPG